MSQSHSTNPPKMQFLYGPQLAVAAVDAVGGHHNCSISGCWRHHWLLVAALLQAQRGSTRCIYLSRWGRLSASAPEKASAVRSWQRSSSRPTDTRWAVAAAGARLLAGSSATTIQRPCEAQKNENILPRRNRPTGVNSRRTAKTS